MIAVSRPRRLQLLLLALLVGSLALLGHTAPAHANVIVTLTFDDGLEDQYSTAAPKLAAHGVKGTFYVNTANLGDSTDNMTMAQVHALGNAGHEIGGHTLDHQDLLSLTHDQRVHEICGDRVVLANEGFRVTSFAYPYGDGAYDADTRSVAANCGYNSARFVAGIKTPRDCTNCDLAESIPPSDKWAMRTGDSTATTTLAEFEGYVSQAQTISTPTHDVWVQYVFHHVCTCNEEYQITPTNFDSLLTWLQGQHVTFKTIDQVMGGDMKPAVSAPPTAVPGGGMDLVPNPGFETADAMDSTQSSCWETNGYGGVPATIARTSDAHGGGAAGVLTVTGPATDAGGGDAKIITKRDTPGCTIPVDAGTSYQVSAWYKSTATSSLVLLAKKNGVWGYLVDHGFLATNTWTLAKYDTGPLAAGITELAVGMSLDGPGTVQVDDFGLAYADQLPPFVALTAPSDGATVNGTVPLSAYASDDSGVAHVDFLINGQLVGSASAAPYAYQWDTRAIQRADVLLQVRATDAFGNSSLTETRTLHVDNLVTDTTAPTSAITCDEDTCEGFHRAPTLVKLSGTDDSSGIAAIRYTLDGSTPTAVAGTTYTTPLTLSATTTVRWFAYDAAGNAEAVQTQLVTVDGAAPVTTATCAPGGCGASLSAPDLTLSLAATDAGSGVKEIRFTTDGSNPTPTNGTVYLGPIPITTSTTVKFRAYDNVGNPEGVRVLAFHVDHDAPVSFATCNGDPCGTSAYGATVTVALGADDEENGSGLARIRYTLDGSDPTATHGTTYRTALHVARAATIRFRSYDNVGNVEAVRSVALVVDHVAPTSTVTSPAAGATLVHGQAATATATAADLDSARNAGSGVASVAFYLDGHLVGTDTSAPYAVTFTTPAAAIGNPRNLYVVATDALGNARQSRYVKVRVS